MDNIKDFFNRLDKENIEYVVWKNCNLIEEFFNGNENLDIYVDQKNKEKFQLFLRINLWVEAKSTAYNFSNIFHYLKFDEKKIYHIHVYFKLITGNSISKNYDLSNLKNYFKDKIYDEKNNLWLMNYDLQLELFKIRIACKNQSLLGSYLIKRDLSNYINEFELLSKNSQNNNYNSILNAAIDKNELKIINKIDKKNILNYISKYKRISNLSSLFHEINFILKILFKKIFKYKKFRFKKNIYIFISGADSSGKTTLINELEILFSKYFKTKKFNIGKPYPNFIGKILFTKKNKLSLINKDISYLKIIKNTYLGMLRYLYSVYIFNFNNNTNIFLFDRYISEYPGHINGPRLIQNEKLNIVKKIIFKVENFFYYLIRPVNTEFRLITNVETCILRNRNRIKAIKETDEDIVNRHKLFSKTIFKSKRVIELNNDLNKNETIKNIIKIVLKDINENN